MAGIYIKKARKILTFVLALILAVSLGASSFALHNELGLTQKWPKPFDGSVEYIQGDRMYFHVPVPGGFKGNHFTGLTATDVMPKDLYDGNGNLLRDKFIYSATYRHYAEIDTTAVEPGDYRFYFIDVYPLIDVPHHDYVYQDVTLLAAQSPSAWAEKYTGDAISLGLIPLSMQNRYTSSITRDDFAKLACVLIERKADSSIQTLLDNRGLSLEPNPFSDVNNDDEEFQNHIIAAYKLGIINGRGDGIFDPTGLITRQEAAAMLRRVGEVLELRTTRPKAKYSDSDLISDWAVADVDFVTGTGIMSGVSPGVFDPLGTYSYEQAYTTMLRMFRL
jgi:S-layer homology domain.